MPKALRKGVTKEKQGDMHRYCHYCKANRDGCGFNKHQAACKIIWQIRQRQENPRSLEIHSEEQRFEKVINPSVPIAVSADLKCYVLKDLQK